MSHWSANRATVRSVRVRPLPPITIGTFACTGLGSHQASVTVKYCPEKFVTRVVEQRADDLDALVEAVEALPQRAELDAVGRGLHLVPAGAHAELEPPAGDDVERRRHVGGDRRMTVVHAVHHRPEPQPVVACASAASIVQPSRFGPSYGGASG